jgi:hypothetical protein
MLSSAPRPPKPWWQIAEIQEFRSRAEDLTHEQRVSLLAEIKGAIAKISTTVGDPSEDSARRKRARAALGYMIEKRHALSALVACGINAAAAEKRAGASEWRQVRRQRLAAARASASKGDALAAIRELLSIFEDDAT